jgi:two-component system chemotaxis sensor kinase CheA
MTGVRREGVPASMTEILKKVVLPKQISAFEARYLERINRISLAFFALHLPVFALVAFINHTKPGWAVLLTALVLVGPTVAYFMVANPRAVSVVYGITAMFMGGLLVHFGQGPVQIEMHFYFFALIAMLAVYGNPLVIVAAAGTVALHHLMLWFIVPASVFNYDAQVWVVAIHVAFVVLESVATCFIARSFFDNVIGLEKIVQARTIALDERNRDLRLVLDNVGQGFLTIDRNGTMSSEQSAVVETWLGAPAPDSTLADLVAKQSSEFAARLRLGWDEVISDVLPLDLAVHQMPSLLVVGERHLRFEFKPIMNGDIVEKALVVISDVSVDVQRARVEAQRRQAMAIFERLTADRSGFLEFLEEGTALVDAIASGKDQDFVTITRMVHTLKGNCAIYGVTAASELCHEMETSAGEEGVPPRPDQIQRLVTLWDELRADVDRLIGSRRNLIELDEQQYRDLLSLSRDGGSRALLQRKLEELTLEPTRTRLQRIAEQARGIARRLTKGEIEIAIEDHDLRLDPKRWATFWSAFIHAVRNAADHGLEGPDERASGGKSNHGRLSLRTMSRGNDLVIEIEDDGRGIDWNALAERARRLGFPTSNDEDIREALFRDGVSTAQEVSDVSGRGVGMGAVRAAARALGGDVTVHSAPGQGTRIEITFPLGDERPPTPPPRPPSATARTLT